MKKKRKSILFNFKNNNIFLILFILLFLFGILVVFSNMTGKAFFETMSTPGLIDSCQTLDTPGTYLLASNITNNTLTSNCISILVDNVTLDCQNNFISTNKSVSGIYTDKANTTIKNCNITVGTNSLGYAIHFNKSNNGLIINVTTQGNIGIFINFSRNNTISNITSNNNTQQGIYMESSSNNVLSNITAFNNSLYGIYLLNSSNNVLMNITSNNNFASGIYLYQDSNNNSFYNLEIHGNPIFGGFNIQECNDTEIINSNFSDNPPMDIYLCRSFRVSCLNCSYNISKEVVDADCGNSELIRKWYLDIIVNDTSGNLIDSANVSTYNSSNDLESSTLTNSSGYTQQILTEYVNNGISINYYSNYSIIINKSDYQNNTINNLNMTNNQEISVILEVSESNNQEINNPININPGSGGGGGTGNSNKEIINDINENDLKKGIEETISYNNKLKFNLSNESHNIVLKNISNNQAIFSIMSEPIELSLFIGEEKIIDINKDNNNDLLIKLNSISNNKANITIKSYEIKENNISNNKSELNLENKNLSSSIKNTINSFSKKSNIIFYIIMVIFIILIIIIIFIIKNKFKKNNKIQNIKN